MDPNADPILFFLCFLGTYILKGQFYRDYQWRLGNPKLQFGILPAPRWFALRETRKSDDRHQAPAAV